jgi:hypothetical protein
MLERMAWGSKVAGSCEEPEETGVLEETTQVESTTVGMLPMSSGMPESEA